MWQIDFYMAMQRERERLDELERQRRLADAARAGGRASSAGSPWRRRVTHLLAVGRQVAGSLGGALDRPAIGPHHQ